MAPRKCVICGKVFDTPPSNNKITCSPACRSRRASIVGHAREKYTWSEAARQARREDTAIADQLRRVQPAAVAKAMEDPRSQRGPQHRESKVWTLYPPGSTTPIRVRGLRSWARENYALFEPGSQDIEASARRISAGFQAIAATLAGTRKSARPATTYKGWTMRTLPEAPTDPDTPDT